MPKKVSEIREIKEHAIFIADAHYPHHGDALLSLLKDLESKELKASQLFLMGDIFDLLFGYNQHIQTFSTEAIKRLQRLSETMEIHYLEGNHDFCLKDIFPHIKVYSRNEQPVEFKLNNQSVQLAHGDLYETGFGYNLYCRLLRNPITLTLLRPFQKLIINHRIKKLGMKKICKPFKNFEKRANAIEQHYPKKSLIIEGHFHQAKEFKNYISLPSLACQNQIATILKGKLVFKSLY